MKFLRLVFAVAASVLSCSATASSLDIRDAWKDETGSLAKSVDVGAGFSFKYDGRSIGPEFSSEWHPTFKYDAKAAASKAILTHGSGLIVTRETRGLPSFGAIEYTLHFDNASTKRLAPVSSVHALNVSVAAGPADEHCVIASGGGLADGFLPPRSFAIRTHCFAPTVPGSGRVYLTTEGGRSSNKDLPFFLIHNEARQEGLFVAFGWSGQWGVMVQQDSGAGRINIRGRIPDLEIALEPGEQIKGPTVLLGRYKGALADGANTLRRLIRDEYTPLLAGKRFLPVATYDNFWAVGDDYDEALLRKLADGAAAIGQEYFLLDAGWYEGESWFTSLGNWKQVNTTKLPNGLKSIADDVRSRGLKFGLWFEPERVAEGSQLAKQHPEWILWDHGSASAPWFGHAPWSIDLNEDSNSAFYSKRFGLLDFGQVEVQQWVKNLLDRYISDYGIKYIRYDFNLDPLPYWEANDKPNRRGITQLRHIQGFYSIIDWIRKRHPDTVLEACASGGRRIDLETARRFHTFWISDHTVDPSIIRYHLFGINNFLPGNYHYIAYTLPTGRKEDFLPDDLGFQSLFGGAFGTGGPVHHWPEDMRLKALLHVSTWKRLRRYLVEDYYPLSSQPGDLKSWSGWQFHDREGQSGFIQTFRAKAPHEMHRFLIQGLAEQARYRFIDVYGTESFEVVGSEAMTEGVEISQDPMSSRVFTYIKISE